MSCRATSYSSWRPSNSHFDLCCPCIVYNCLPGILYLPPNANWIQVMTNKIMLGQPSNAFQTTVIQLQQLKKQHNSWAITSSFFIIPSAACQGDISMIFPTCQSYLEMTENDIYSQKNIWLISIAQRFHGWKDAFSMLQYLLGLMRPDLQGPSPQIPLGSPEHLNFLRSVSSSAFHWSSKWSSRVEAACRECPRMTRNGGSRR